MDQEDPVLGDNLERLLRSAYGPAVRPDTEMRSEMLRRLSSELRTGRSLVLFPDWALGLLAGVLLLAAVWLFSQVRLTGVSLAADPTLLLVAAILIVNIALAPIAGAVIVWRRRYAQA